MSFLYTAAAFIAAILILVSLHELGHLLAARACGIKVLRFSVGFGKPLFRKNWRGIEWCLAPIPLGGYVKMTDTRVQAVAEADLPHAFDRQHPFKRIVVVAAGPLTNLMLAIVLYASSFHLGGIETVRPIIGTVSAPSAAASAGFQAGDKIISVNGSRISDWEAAQTQILFNLENGSVKVAVEQSDGKPAVRHIQAASAQAAAIVSSRQAFGLLPQKFSNRIAEVLPDSPAQRAGLQAGDIITGVDGTPTPTLESWQEIIRANAGRNLDLIYVRNGKSLQTRVLPDSDETSDPNRIIGRIGVVSGVDIEWQKRIISRRYPAWSESVGLAWRKTIGYTALSLRFFGRLISGQASPQHISGPVTIARLAGDTAQHGWQSYTEFLAAISISLFVMNMLPVPMLDGGHLLYYTVEWIRGRPLSTAAQNFGFRIGLALIGSLMFLAFFNDMSRLFG